MGPACILLKKDLDIPKRELRPEEREEEISRFEHGLLETRKQIAAIRAEVAEKVGESEAGIFDAHQMVLEDRALIEEAIREVVEGGYNIEYSFQQVANRYIDAFSQIDDPYIKERVTDIRDVTHRLLANLLGRQEMVFDTMDAANIIIAEDLSPSETAHLDHERVFALATEHGSKTSHSVIMARSLNVPCVIGVKELVHQIQPGDTVLVDGFEGIVILNPSEASRYRYGQLEKKRARVRQLFDRTKHEPACTRDGKEIRMLLNIEGHESDELLRNCGAAGVGLFRTESLFLAKGTFPDEDAQYAVYGRVAAAMDPFPVTIRTLDLGGDKNPHNSLYGYSEANPFMGYRAIRFCLDNIPVFKAQLRAILRASAHGKIKIMYPMISSCEEVIRANAVVNECKQELVAEGKAFDEAILTGCMIEVPSAAVITDLLADHCDFFSIGTNDLIQYLLAVDRVNDRISHLYCPENPAVLRALNFIFQAGHRTRKPISVCGEMAGDPIYAPLLFGMGADELSVAWGIIPEIKYLIRGLSHEELRELAAEVLHMKEVTRIRARLREFYESHVGEAR